MKEKFSSMGPISDEELSRQYDKFVIKYGKENADYLMEVMGGWQSHYNRAVFIDLEIYKNEASQEKVRSDAERGEVGLLKNWPVILSCFGNYSMVSGWKCLRNSS